MNKKLLKVIISVILLFFVGWGIFLLTHPGGRTGAQWLAKQSEYMNQISTFAEDVDTITALYISGSISETDFLNHINVFEKELNILKNVYNDELKNTPVRIGTHTYYTKEGCESVKESYILMENILTMLKENSSDKSTLSYKYIAYQQEVTQKVVTFMFAYYYTFGE